MRISRYPHILTSALAILGFTVLSSLAGEVIHYQVLKSFGSVTNDGTSPFAALVQGPDGALYGETVVGGSNGSGMLFKLNLDGSGYQILHHFGDGATDGARPQGGLTAASNGLLYGTTYAGGARGGGTIFQLQPDGTGYMLIRSFGGLTDGTQPEAPLIEGNDGALYGTTYAGPGSNYGGTLFVINKDGTGYRLLHRFGPFSSADGLQPMAPVVEGSDGALYGTTSTGGGGAVGSVFRVNKDGTSYQKLHAFGLGSGSINPFAGLLEGSDGAFYGTGGGGAGGVFKLNKDGSGYRELVGFNEGWPFAALTKGRDGALYSTTTKDAGAGTVFRLNEDGSGYAILHTFGAEGDGRAPQTTLVLATDGAFYGTTSSGGEFGRGTIFRLLVNRTPIARCADVTVTANDMSVGNAFVEHGSFDPDGGTITLVQTPPGPYPVGTNRVTLTVTDSNGDSDTCNALITVLGARALKEGVLDELVALRGATSCGPNRHRGGRSNGDDVCQELDAAIKHLRASLNPAWWVNQTHLQRRYGRLVFETEDATVARLCFLIHNRSKAVPSSLLEGFIARLDQADRLLASVAIEEAIAAGAPSRRIENAQKFLARGDAAALVDPCGKAIALYRQAWEYAVRPNASRPTQRPGLDVPGTSHGGPRD